MLWYFPSAMCYANSWDISGCAATPVTRSIVSSLFCMLNLDCWCRLFVFFALVWSWLSVRPEQLPFAHLQYTGAISAISNTLVSTLLAARLFCSWTWYTVSLLALVPTRASCVFCLIAIHLTLLFFNFSSDWSTSGSAPWSHHDPISSSVFCGGKLSSPCAGLQLVAHI